MSSAENFTGSAKPENEITIMVKNQYCDLIWNLFTHWIFSRHNLSSANHNFFYFSEKTRHGISSELSAIQSVCIKYQILVFLKNNKKQ